jgi:hypothetical protein
LLHCLLHRLLLLLCSCRVLGEPDNVLARNFAVHGGMSSDSSNGLWWKESTTSYKVRS